MDFNVNLLGVCIRIVTYKMVDVFFRNLVARRSGSPSPDRRNKLQASARSPGATSGRMFYVFHVNYFFVNRSSV